VAIERPPAVTYSTSVYGLPTGGNWGLVRWSVTESMMLWSPTQKKVAMTASPLSGFRGLNPLMRTFNPRWLSVLLSVSNVMPFAGGGGGGAGGGGAAVIVNGALVTPVRFDAVAVSVYPLPALSMLRFGKLATPFTAAAVVVPDSVPPLGLFVPRATVIVPLKAASVLPAPSCAATRTAGEIVLPAVVPLGWTVNASCVAAA